MTPPELILASTSPYRRALLERLGLPFRSVAPGIDEEALKHPLHAPQPLAEMLAEAKARSLAADFPSAAIIGSDQLVALHHSVLGKPGTADQAIEQLLQMSGQRHELITAMVVVQGNRLFRHTDITHLHMRRLTRPEIERYVEADRPLDCAGAYKLECRGIALFHKIESADQSAITGLPLIVLTTILRDLGFAVP
jgi:septum formation protein